MYFSLYSKSGRPERTIKPRGELLVVLIILILGLLVACGSPTPVPTPTPPPLAQKLVLYNWAGYMPQAVLDAFTAEYGVMVDYQVYETQEQAVENMRTGKVYDVVVMGNEFIPPLAADSLLAEIDRSGVSNFKNISPSFRNLVYDPGNRYTVPFLWGTTGLVVRSDLVEQPITRWADLWDERYAGRVAVWPIQRELIGIALKSLGYSVNSEEPAELESALARLLELKPRVILWDNATASIIPVLTSGQAVIADGWAYDAQVGREENEAIVYVLPEEGTILWGDNLVIPTNSPHQSTAELFLNFILRPEISAQIVNELYYASANRAAEEFVDPEILKDPLIFPPAEALQKAEISLPLSPEGQKLYDDIWARFIAAGQE
jgi:spermidine/putrescine transport system substrate-binding protein